MRAVQLSRFGGPEVLEIVESSTPTPQAGELLVRVGAAGINFFEVLMRQNRYAVTPDLPMALGVEAAGVVEAVGEGVVTPAVGTRVAVPLFALGRSGGYADYVIADASSVVALPDGLSFEDATTLLVQGLTALHLVRQSPPKDKAVLVNAAAGGVGSLLVQLARDSGARLVVAAVGSNEKRELALSLGADIAVDYGSPIGAGTSARRPAAAAPTSSTSSSAVPSRRPASMPWLRAASSSLAHSGASASIDPPWRSCSPGINR